MRFLQLLRARYNRILEHAIRICTLTAITFTVTACYGVPNKEYNNDIEWRTDKDSVERQVEQLHQRIMQQHSQDNTEQNDNTIANKQ